MLLFIYLDSINAVKTLYTLRVILATYTNYRVQFID
jgi:hypothetical protein